MTRERGLRLVTASGLVLLLGAFAALLAVRFVPGLPIDGADEAEYMATARRVAEGEGLGVRPVDPYHFVGLNLVEGRDGAYYGKHPFGYPLLCAAAIRLGGRPAAYLVSPVCAVLALLGLFALGRRLAGDAGALAAVALLATNPLHAGYALTPMSHAAALAATLAGLALAWRWAERGGWAAALGAGVLCGLAGTVRLASVLLALPLGVAALRRLRLAGGGAAGRAAAETALAALGGALALAPLLLHQWHAWGSPWLTGQMLTEGSGLDVAYAARNLQVLAWRLWSSGLWIPFVAGLAGLLVLAVRRRFEAAFLAAWALGPFVLATLFYWRRPSDHYAADLRYYLDVFPPLLLAAVTAVAVLWARPRARTLALAGLLLAALPVQLAETNALTAGAARGNQSGARIGAALREAIPEGSVVFTDEDFVHALPAFGDYRVYYDAMFHPSFVASYLPLLEHEGPWPVSRRRVERWREELAGRSEAELAGTERDIVARHLTAGRRVFFATGVNYVQEWRERLGARFAVEPVMERRLYWSERDPRHPSRRLLVFELREP